MQVTGDNNAPDLFLRGGALLFSAARPAAGALFRPCFDDLDNDGDIDVVILNSNAPPSLLRNDSIGKNHWLQLSLRGTTGNRDGVGAKVRVFAGDQIYVDEVHSGRGYQSHFGTRLHFGLGDKDRVDKIEVRWPNGKIEKFDGVQTNQHVHLREGTQEK